MTKYYFKSLNFYKNKWERHNKIYETYDEALNDAERLNRLSGRTIELYSVENKKSILLLTIPENID